MAKSKSELRALLDGLASEAAEQTRLYDSAKEAVSLLSIALHLVARSKAVRRVS